jgi:hypothetical protein
LWSWLPQVAEALDFLHASGWVHGDIKPSNILFDGHGLPYLADVDALWLVKTDTMPSSGSTAPNALGTVGYLAPECFSSSDRTPQSDQYALAVSVYEMIAGRSPFESPISADVALAHALEAADPLSFLRRSVNDEFAAAVGHGLAKDPTLRFETCGAFAQAVLRSVRRPTTRERLRLTCPHCGRLLSVDSESCGRAGMCPRCRGNVVVAKDLQSLVDPAERQKERQPGLRCGSFQWRIGDRAFRRLKAALAFTVIMLALVIAGRQRAHRADILAPDRLPEVNRPLARRPHEAIPQLNEPGQQAAVVKDKAAANGVGPENRAARIPDAQGQRQPHAPERNPIEPPPRPRVVQDVGLPLRADEQLPADEQPAPDAVVHRVPLLPLPPDEAVKEAVKEIRSTWKDVYDLAGRDNHSLVLVTDLLATAQATEDPLRRFALLLEAERLALNDRRLDVAVECIRQRAITHNFDTVAAQRSAVGTIANGGKLWNPRIAHESLCLAHSSLDGDQRDLAADAIALARLVAGAVESEAIAEQIKAEADSAAARLSQHRHNRDP